MNRDIKEIGTHSAHGAHGGDSSPLALLRAKFGISITPTAAELPVVAAPTPPPTPETPPRPAVRLDTRRVASSLWPTPTRTPIARCAARHICGAGSAQRRGITWPISRFPKEAKNESKNEPHR